MHKIKILYISSKRAEERDLLSYLKTVEFKEIQIHLRSDRIKFINKLISLFTYIKTFKPDMLLLEGPAVFSLIAVFIKKFFHIPYAVRIKGDFERQYAENEYDIPFYQKIIKYLNYKSGLIILKYADAFLPISNHVAVALKTKLKIDKPMYIVNIPYCKIYKPAKYSPIKLEEKFVLTVTNFNFWGKVQPLGEVINTIALILKKYGFSWIILGDGLFFKKFVQTYKSHENVKFMGRQNPYPFYKQAKALFYISGMDGLPNVLLEAFYYNVPVIIDKNCPAIEFVRNKENGLIIDFKDVQHVEYLLQQLERDSKFFKVITENAFNYVSQKFSIENVSAQLEKAIEQIISFLK